MLDKPWRPKMNVRPHRTKPKTFVIKFWHQKRHYKRTIAAQSLRNAMHIAAIWRGQVASGEWVPMSEIPKDLLMSTATDRFIEDYAKPRKKSWHMDLVYKRRCDEFFQGRALSQITAQDVERFRTWLSTQGVRGKPMGSCGVNRYHQFAKAVVRKMTVWRLYAGENPFTLVKLADERRSQRTRFLTEDEFQRLIAVTHPELRDILIVGAHTGLRRSDLRKLTKEQVRLSDPPSISLPDPKSGRPEWVPMSDTVYHVLDRRMRLLPDSKATVFDFTNFERRWKAARRDAAVTNLRFHDATRHTAASWITMKSGSLFAAQKILRHKSPAMTERYAHLAQGHLRKIMQGMDEVLPVTAPAPQPEPVAAMT